MAIALGLLCASGSGCTPALATMEPARIAPQGHWQITSSLGGSMITGKPFDQLLELIDLNNLREISM